MKRCVKVKANSRIVAVARAFKRKQAKFQCASENHVHPTSEGNSSESALDITLSNGSSPADANKTNADVADKPRRGPTMCNKVHGRSEEERLEIILNDDCQPIGPDDGTLNEFISFLGTIARKVNILPLTVSSWLKFDKEMKEELWEYVLKHYIVPVGGKKWVLKAIGDAWRGYKCRVKKHHFKKYKTDEARLENRPNRIPLKMFKALLKLWNTKAQDDISKKYTKNRASATKKNIQHTAGPRSFARVKEDWKKKNKTTKDPTPAQIFMETRKEKKTKRKAGDPRDKIIGELKDSTSTESEDVEDVIASLFDSENEKRRRLRLYGRGVTPSRLKQKAIEEAAAKKREEEVQAVKHQYELERQKDREYFANGLRSFFSQFQQHPAMSGVSVDFSMFGPLLIADQAPEDNVGSGSGTLRLTQSQSSSSTRRHDKETHFAEEDNIEDEDEDLTR